MARGNMSVGDSEVRTNANMIRALFNGVWPVGVMVHQRAAPVRAII